MALVASPLERSLAYVLLLNGTNYGWWTGGPIPIKAPAWATNAPPPPTDDVKDSSCFCAGIPNLMLRVARRPIPCLNLPMPDPECGQCCGGTGAYGRNFTAVAKPFDLSKNYTRGTLLGRPYRSVSDQGHVAILLGTGRSAALLQSFSYQYPSGRPGVTTHLTLEEMYLKYSFGRFTYAIAPEDWIGSDDAIEAPRDGKDGDVPTLAPADAAPVAPTVQVAEHAGAQPQLASAIALDAYPMATCLDGSSARYYISRGAAHATSWLLFFEGGGFCGSVSDCRARSLTALGSTKNDTVTMRLDDRYYFSRETKANPLLAHAHHVYVRYCDGAYYSGERRTPLHDANATAGAPLYFRGRWITEAVVADLRAHHALEDAREIVVAGCSAGAIRVFAHLDALRQMLPPTARVVGFADSGFYLDRPIFTPLKRFVVLVSGHNATALLNGRCRDAHPWALEKCLVAQVSGFYLSTPLFAFQSRYDLDQRGCEMTRACAASTACISEYGANLTVAMHTWLGATARSGAARHAAFLDGCSRHCDDSDVAKGSFPLRMHAAGTTPLQALAKWFSGAPARLEQPGEFPCDGCCGAI